MLFKFSVRYFYAVSVEGKPVSVFYLRLNAISIYINFRMNNTKLFEPIEYMCFT